MKPVGDFSHFKLIKLSEPLNWNDIETFVKFLINNAMPILADYALRVYCIQNK
jgi:hypothetical protein